jgi:MYXO-CTERM domain-containing protein
MGSCKKRGSTDFSAAADSTAGISVYSSSSSPAWNAVLGTSAATPIVAAIMARLGVKGQTPAFVYQNASAFYDVTSGNNDPGGTCNDVMCNAGPGWDGPTGVGTPNGALLAAAQQTTPAGDAGTDSGTPAGDDGGSTTTDSGAPVVDSGSPSTFDSGSTVIPPTTGNDAGSTLDAGNLEQLEAGTGDSFTPTGQSSGCGCATPGTSSPLGGAGAGALGLGLAMAALARRRKR